MSTNSSRVRLSLALVLALSLGSCEAVSSLTSGPLGAALSKVQGLTGDVGKWSSMLGSGDISDKLLSKLAGFSGSAGGIGEMLKKALMGAEDSVQKKIAPVQDGLTKLSGLNAENLMGLDQEARRKTTNDFTANANNLSDLVGKLLGGS